MNRDANRKSANAPGRLEHKAMAANQPALVTVCVPTTGRLGYLELALDSLARQTYRNREILILDNGSPSPAQEVLAGFVAANPDARILRADERVPMFANFNRGIAEAKGEFIVFFHDDDIYEPQFIEHYVAVLERYPEAVFAGGNYDTIDGEGRTTRLGNTIAKTEIWDGSRFAEDIARRGRMRISTPGIMFRSSILKPTGFPEEISLHWGDIAMLMRMAEDRAVVMIAERLFRYRVHGTNASAKPLSDAVRMRTDVMVPYCRDRRARRPQDAALIDRMEGHLRRTYRRDLIAGWLAAPHAEEAETCLRALEPVAPLPARALRAAQRLGLGPGPRQTLFRLLKRAGEALRM
jgi:glycosyltransferase involved in cell wall biosynthesis